MTLEQLHQQTTALELLPIETKSIIYYALGNLKNTAEKLIEQNELTGTPNCDEIVQFQKNIADKCFALQVYFITHHDSNSLSLLTHFAPSK